MRFRRAAGTVVAIRFDGSERVAREISTNWGDVAFRAGMIQVATAFGRRIVRVGEWLVLDLVTGVLRVVDDGDFQREHEVIS